MTQATSAVT